MSNKRRWWLFLPPLAIGVAGLVLLVGGREQPSQSDVVEIARSVRYIEVPRIPVVPTVVAFGTVAPGKVWESVAQVQGQVVDIHPRLDEGEFFAAGTVALRIDPSDYELNIRQIEADIAATRAQIAENAIREKNTRAALQIEREVLKVNDRELARRQRLAKEGNVSQSDVDQEARSVLAQRQSVLNQENSLNLLPAERERLEAQLARYEAQLAIAQLDLERTTVTVPFTSRLSTVGVELAQFVRQGDVMLRADDISVAEIDAQVPIQQLRNVVQSRDEPFGELPAGDMGELLGIEAEVRMPEFDLVWPARVVRLQPTMDPRTRTVGVVVAVDEPYRQAQGGVRPPLVAEMFVEVTLQGRERDAGLVVPRTAVREDRVFLADENDRLVIRPVEVGLVQAEFVTIRDGLEGGERLVVSDVVPAVYGMLLEPTPDPELLERLRALAAAGAP